MKGILLCDDNSFKLLPLTYTLPTEMIPVANIPIVEYIIKRLVESGINNIAMVVGKNREKFQSYFQNGRAFNCKIEYFYHPKQLGSAHALLCAKEYIDQDFILINGNNYFDFDLNEYINKFKKEKYNAMLLLKNILNSTEYETAEIKEGKITSVIDKDRADNNNCAVTGIYFFSTVILKAISKIRTSYRGEYTLANAVQYLIEKDYKVGYTKVIPFSININNIRDILECNKYILSKNEDNTIVGQNSRIINSEIADYTSIGEGCIIKDAHIRNSIIMDDCIINGVEIYDSIICDYSIIAGKGSINGIFAEKTKTYINSSPNDE